MQKCEFSAGINNEKCDDGNNVLECNWDGGDCCGCFAEKGFCTDCQCKDPDSGDNYCCKLELMADGHCDQINNKLQCQYDALDCCRTTLDTLLHCPLETIDCSIEKLTNHQCDANLNKAACLYDMGQCCNESLAMKSENGRICDINSRGTVLYY